MKEGEEGKKERKGGRKEDRERIVHVLSEGRRGREEGGNC